MVGRAVERERIVIGRERAEDQAQDDGQRIEDVNSGVQAINGGLGVAVTKSWGMVDNRTISAITPVDECTSDVRFMAYIGRKPSRDPDRAATKAQEFGQEIIRQFEQDVEIWRHQRYSDPPALATEEFKGFTAIRKWAKQFYPDGIGGSAAFGTVTNGTMTVG